MRMLVGLYVGGGGYVCVCVRERDRQTDRQRVLVCIYVYVNVVHKIVKCISWTLISSHCYGV